MRIVVAATDPDCPAALALHQEGIDAEIHVCAGAYGFGALVAGLWESGTGFVLVEHDVAPWPGAVDLLRCCPEDWCVHRYPMHVDGTRWWNSTLGCCKFSARLTRENRGMADRWRTVEWQYLDGLVVDVKQLRPSGWHEHQPPVAHVRQR